MAEISIVMPAYNAATYIHDAIRSVISQTFHDWELVIIDSGSIDNSISIINTFKDPRIKLISSQNQGSSAAKNVGLQHVQGEKIVFLDADDALFPKALESNSYLLDLFPESGLVYSDGFYCNDILKPISRLSDYRIINAEGNVLDIITISPLIGASCSAMIQSKIIHKYHIQFDPSLVIGEDWDFFIKLAQRTNFSYNQMVTCNYRIHHSNVTKTHQNRRARDLGKIRENIIESELFQQICETSRYTLIYQLLFENYGGDLEKQKGIIKSKEFHKLTSIHQSTLQQLVASDLILKNSSIDEAITLLKNSNASWSKNRKSHVLYMGLRISPKLTRSILRIYRLLVELKINKEKISPFDI